MSLLILNRMNLEQQDYSMILKGDLHLLSDRTQQAEKSEAYKSVNYFDNFKDNMAVDNFAYDVIKSEQLTSIIATSEYDLIRAAYLREHFNISGQTVESAVAFRNKVTMKDIASKAVKVPSYSLIKSMMCIRKFINIQGYPVVIKPILGAGAIDTEIIKSKAELDTFIEGKNLNNFQIEEYIDGQMYIFDGFYSNGRIQVSWASKYVNDCLSFKEGKQASIVQLADDNPLTSKIKSFAVDLFSVMPMPSATSFHLEVFYTKNNELVLCEVASRTGGGAIRELGVFKYDVDINRLWVQSQAEQLQKLNITQNSNKKIYGFIQIPPIPGKKARLPYSVDIEGVCKYLPNPQGMDIQEVKECSDTIATVIIEGNSEDDVINKMESITSEMQKQCYEEVSNV